MRLRSVSTILTSAAIGGAAVCGLLLAGPDATDDGDASRVARLERELETLRSDTAALREALAQVDGRFALLLAVLEGSASPGPARGAAGVAGGARSGDNPEHRDAAGTSAPVGPEPPALAPLEERIASEAPDEDWTYATEGAVRDELEAGGIPGVELEAVACSESLCRLEFAHAGADAGLLELVHTRAPFDASEFRVQEAQLDDGSTATVVYLARPGEVLQPVE